MLEPSLNFTAPYVPGGSIDVAPVPTSTGAAALHAKDGNAGAVTTGVANAVGPELAGTTAGLPMSEFA